MKQTKAQKIFTDTYTECRIHIKDWGLERDQNGKAIGFNRLSTEEVVCTRTCNAVENLINTEKKMLKFDHEIGIANDWTALCEQALEMVESTLNNQRESIKRWA